jgi:hypothetical protein
MTSGSRKRLTSLAAWLGLMAMWLALVAPTISRLLEASQSLVVPVCVAADQPGAPAHHIRIRLDGQHDAPAAPLNACGYCGLFAHSSLLPTLPPVVPAALLLVLLSLVFARSERFTPLSVFPAGRPRDPPRFS